MRHRKAGVKLNRTTSHRQAMFRNMVTSLLKHDRIKTTDAKAKELRRWADHIITLAKRGDLHARRQAMSIVREKEVVHKLFEEAEKRFGSIKGGYTRIVKIGTRPGDAAPVSLIELVSADDRVTKGKKKTKSAPKKKTEKATAEAPEKEKTEEPKKEPAVDVAAAEAESADEKVSDTDTPSEAPEEMKAAAGAEDQSEPEQRSAEAEADRSVEPQDQEGDEQEQTVEKKED